VKLIAENLNIMAPTVAAALEERRPGPLRELVQSGRQAGVEIFDLNVGSHRRRAPAYMEFLLAEIFAPLPATVAVSLDTTCGEALAVGLQLAAEQQRPAIVNALSLEEEKWELVLPLVSRDENCRLVLLLMSPRIPLAAEERLLAVLDSLARLEEAGITPDRLLVDPVVVPLGWEDGHLHSREIIRFLQLLPEAVPAAPATVVGLSNIATRSTGRRIRQEAETVFLAMAAAAGLDYALVNIRHREVMRTARLIRILQGRELFSPAALDN